MAGMKLSELEFLRLLPVFMRDDEAVKGLSKAMDKILGEPSERIPTIRTWDMIDELNDKECDALAWELDVDWYDDTLGLEEKRATIEAAQQIKRKRGTKWAVEQLITAYFGEGYVVEWYEIGGRPFEFIAMTTNTAITQEDYAKFVEAVRAAKNSRSHIAGVFYFWEQGPDPGIGVVKEYADYKYDFLREAGTYPSAAVVGMAVTESVEADPEAAAINYALKQTGDLDCGTYPQPGTVGALVNHQAATAPGVACTSYDFVQCGTRRCGE